MKKSGSNKIVAFTMIKYTRKLYFLRVNEKKYCYGKT